MSPSLSWPQKKLFPILTKAVELYFLYLGRRIITPDRVRYDEILENNIRGLLNYASLITLLALWMSIILDVVLLMLQLDFPPTAVEVLCSTMFST